MKELTIDGMSISSNVIETVVGLALNDVQNVVQPEVTTVNGFMAAFQGKASALPIECSVDEDNKLVIGVHVDVEYGTPLPEIAAAVREAVYNAVTMQIGAPVSRIDVYVDGVKFDN